MPVGAGSFWDVEQLAQLAVAVERASAGDPTLLIIEGAAGTGKSTLLQELDTRLRGFTVCEAADVESGLPP